jgi:hypothetical protein
MKTQLFLEGFVLISTFLVIFFMVLTNFMQIITNNIKKKQIKILNYKTKIFVDIFQIRKFMRTKKNLY